jgi:hypothetical protein
MAISVTEFQELKSQEICKMVSMQTQNISGSQVSIKRPGKTMVRNIWSLAPLVLSKREKLTKIITYYTLLIFWSASLGFSRRTELGFWLK